MTSSRLPARLSPRPVRTVARRIARSRFAADLRVNGAVIAGCLLIVVLALAVGLLTRGESLTWDGWVDVRPGATATFGNS